ncbi:MAG: N-acetylmuramoyl-L-alanine amidase [Gordonia sp. (in: high G+C Gram-positive bacteria)]
MATPEFLELDRMGSSLSSRNGAWPTLFLLHTEEGGSSAESLAAYLNNPNNGASYHYTVRDGIVCDVVDTDYASWSVLDANAYSINLCFAGSRAAWSRAQWLIRENDIRIAAWLAVADCKKYGIPTTVLAPPYRRGSGISDHRYVTLVLGIGTHTDVGDGFPWDRFATFVAEFASGQPSAPPVNRIDEAAAKATWLGRRITVGELVCPDQVGRYARFENGHVYWHPVHGAHAVPTAIFETWAGLTWEAGPLGYPVTDRTLLREGVVQGFQYGAIYRKNGQPGWPIGGDIRLAWNRSGFEDGPWGWPTSGEIATKAGARVQHFEHGTLVWSPTRVVGIDPAGGIA